MGSLCSTIKLWLFPPVPIRIEVENELESYEEGINQYIDQFRPKRSDNIRIRFP